MPGIFTFYVPSAVPLYVTPLEGFDFTLYNVNSRPASISGDYGIIGDNGTIIKSDTQYIINETNNTYTNPATGTTETITNWTYDYSDRSYNVITESGDTITITYGDENITINEGDTVYNIYYVTEVPEDGGGDTPSPSPTPHVHDYQASAGTPATCVVSGSIPWVCSGCGSMYTETIPATGHMWSVVSQVNTEYDSETGELIQQGYTIYRCENCGEQYKDESGNGPPNTAPPSGSGGSGIFSGIFGILWDFCSFFFDFFSGFVVGGISGFLKAMKDGASGFFDILNPVGWFT